MALNIKGLVAFFAFLAVFVLHTTPLDDEVNCAGRSVQPILLWFGTHYHQLRLQRPIALLWDFWRTRQPFQGLWSRTDRAEFGSSCLTPTQPAALLGKQRHLGRDFGVTPHDKDLQDRPCPVCMHESGHALSQLCAHHHSITASPFGIPTFLTPLCTPLHHPCLHPASQTLWTLGFQLSSIQAANKSALQPHCACPPWGGGGGGGSSRPQRVQIMGWWGSARLGDLCIQPCAWGGRAEGGACTSPGL